MWKTLIDNMNATCAKTFGEDVVYQLSVGNSLTIKAIFDNNYQQVDPDTGAIISSNHPVLFIKLSDLSRAPAKGDRITIRGLNYRVTDTQEDSEGGCRLMLHRTSS